MNFDHVPELHGLGGYPFALGLMAPVCVGPYTVFNGVADSDRPGSILPLPSGYHQNRTRNAVDVRT